MDSEHIDLRAVAEVPEMDDERMRGIQADQMMLGIMRAVRYFNATFPDRRCDVMFTIGEDE
jgi:hypothetical protein